MSDFSLFVFLEDGCLGKIEYFKVIMGKASSSRAGQDIVFVVDFSRNTVRLWYCYLCLCPPLTKFTANMEACILSKDWTITWTLVNCFALIFRKAFERWQTFALFQKEDKGIKGLAPGSWWRGLCNSTRKQAVNIRAVLQSQKLGKNFAQWQ